jgi:uncharacterized protein (DUF302 family)
LQARNLRQNPKRVITKRGDSETMSLMQRMMFSVYQSELGFDETVAALREAARRNGWDVRMEHDLQECYVEAGYEDMTRATTLYLCYPDGGYQIMKDDANKPLSAMMPMGVSVYETNEGEVRIAGMNLERMSMMMGGTAKQVFSQGATSYKNALAELEKTEPLAGETQVDKKACLLGCLGAIAAVVGLLAGMVVLMVNLMPKIMTVMMPKMMGAMEEAGVQPPCAQIILEHMEGQEAVDQSSRS